MDCSGNHAEWQYLDILSDILINGVKKEDRTGTGTLSVFGRSIRHDFKHGFPLLTSKKMFTKGIIHELIWFLKATEDAQYLIDNNVHIWDGWMKPKLCKDCSGSGKVFVDLDHLGWIDADCDDCFGEGVVSGFILPHTYGIKWRNFDGVDQIQNAIKQIKENPNSRRILVSAWDPRHINDAALPWCHDSFQFIVENDKLNLWWRQRSVDWFLGCPFNIASYAFLLCMVCEVTGYKPGILWGTFGDVHLYLDHVEQAQQQLKNATEKIYDLPSFKIARSVGNIDDFQHSDFIIENYQSWPTIKAKVSI